MTQYPLVVAELITCYYDNPILKADASAVRAKPQLPVALRSDKIMGKALDGTALLAGAVKMDGRICNCRTASDPGDRRGGHEALDSVKPEQLGTSCRTMMQR